MEGLANIVIHRFSMNNNEVIWRTCLLVQRGVPNMLVKPGCSGSTVLACLFRFIAENCAAVFTRVTIIHILATPIIHEYHCSLS